MLALPHGAADTARIAVRRHRSARRHGRAGTAPDARRRRSAPSRAAAAVRNRERLVQVQMADVGADRRRTGEPDLGVHVGAVHVHLAAVLVDDGADLADVVLEHTMRRRIRDHQARQPVAVRGRFLAQVSDIHVAVRCARHDNHAHARHGAACRIGAVRRRRDEHDVTMALARDRWNARITRSPANSPWAPEFGCSDIAAKPVIAQSAASSSSKICR